MPKKLRWMLALLWGTVLCGGLSAQTAMMDGALGDKFFTADGQSVTLTAIDGLESITLSRSAKLAPSTPSVITVTYCTAPLSTLQSSSVVELSYSGDWRPRLPFCPSSFPIWTAKDQSGNLVFVRQGGASFNPALDKWLPGPDFPIVNRGFFFEATNLFQRGVSVDLTGALLPSGQQVVTVTLASLQGGPQITAYLLAGIGGQGLLILPSGQDLQAGEYLITTRAAALGASALDPTLVFPVTVSGTGATSTPTTVTVQLPSTLPFTQPSGPLTYPVNTTLSWRGPSGGATGSAAVVSGAGGFVLTPDPTSEGMLALWKALPFQSANQAVPANVALSALPTTLSASLTASFAAGRYTLSLSEPIAVPVPATIGALLPANAVVTTAATPSQLVTSSVKNAGWLTLSFAEWQAAAAASPPPTYLVFSGTTTAGVTELSFSAPTASDPLGSLKPTTNWQVPVLAATGTSGLPNTLQLTSGQQTVTMTTSSAQGSSVGVLSLSDWNRVSADPNLQWSWVDSQNQPYTFSFQASPDYGPDAFYTGRGLLGQFSFVKAPVQICLPIAGVTQADFLGSTAGCSGAKIGDATSLANYANIPSWTVQTRTGGGLRRWTGTAELKNSGGTWQLCLPENFGGAPADFVNVPTLIAPTGTNGQGILLSFCGTGVPNNPSLMWTMAIQSVSNSGLNSCFDTTNGVGVGKFDSSWQASGLGLAGDYLFARASNAAKLPTPNNCFIESATPYLTDSKAELKLNVPPTSPWTRVQIFGDLPVQNGAVRLASAQQPPSGSAVHILTVQIKSPTEAYVLTKDLTDLGRLFGELEWVTRPSLDGTFFTASTSWTAGGTITFTKNTQVQDCKNLLTNSSLNVSGWQCSQGQEQGLNPNNLGRPCRMYKCESTNFRRGLAGDGGCQIHSNWQMSSQGPAPDFCFVVPCADYGGWMGTGEGGQCSTLNPPSPNNGLCIWCPNATLQWAGSGYGCGVAPYLPSVHGWFPQGDSSGSNQCRNDNPAWGLPLQPGPYAGP